MKTQKLVLSIMLFAGLSACTLAAGPSVDASVTLDGKPIALKHGRAWLEGFKTSVTTIKVYLAEQDMADLVSELPRFAPHGDDKHGTRLAIELSAVGDGKQFCEPTHHFPQEDVTVKLFLKDPDYGKFFERETVEITDASVTDWFVTGKLHWKGKEDVAENVATTEWSVNFRLPVEGDNKNLLSGKEGAALCSKK